MPSSWLLQGHIASDSSTPIWRSLMLLEGQQIPTGGGMVQLPPTLQVLGSGVLEQGGFGRVTQLASLVMEEMSAGASL